MLYESDAKGNVRPFEGELPRGLTPLPIPAGTSLPEAVRLMTGQAAKRADLSCVHRGGPTGESFQCQSCRGRVEVKVLACAAHGKCTVAKQAPPEMGAVALCAGCNDRLAPESPAAPAPPRAVYGGFLLDGLPDPLPTQEKYPAPADWAWRADVRAQHQQALRKLASAELPAPDGTGDGLVTAGGGAYWPLTRMCVRMLRQWSELPVQVWHRGADDPVYPEELADVPGVTFHDATRVSPAPRWSGDTRWRGWQVKAVALAHCGLRRALWLDSDAYPVRDPAPLLDLATAHRFAAWSSVHSAGTCGWEAFGIDRDWGERISPWQGGHVALDRAACWREIVLFLWLCYHADYSFSPGVGYGDESQWRVALAMTGGRYLNLGQSLMLKPAEAGPGDPDLACVQRLPGSHPRVPGEPVFIHRFAGKGPPMDGAPPGTSPNLPGDELAGKFYRGERGPFPSLRPGTNDAAVWQAVVEQNEYRLPDRMDGWCVLDVGAHVGSFGWACLTRGAGYYLGIESDVENCALGRCNIERAPGRPKECQILFAAAWGATPPRLQAVRRRPNAGMSKVALAGGSPVCAFTLDELIDRIGLGGPVNLLKLDCEGAEWPCLLTARLLGRVRRVVGEYHLAAAADPLYRVDGFEISPESLRRHLEAEGFMVEIEPPDGGGAGHFWATRESL